jgi:TnpA family transposase
MPVNFLTEEQESKYGKFCGEPNEIQLARYFHLDENDMSLITNRRGNQNRLGFALLLTSARFLGAFIDDFDQVPVKVQTFVACQLSIKDISVLVDYGQRETTRREHTAS